MQIDWSQNDFSLLYKYFLPSFFPDEYALSEYNTPCSPSSNWNQMCARRGNDSENIRQAAVQQEEDKRLGFFSRNTIKNM